jgi:hypothetical protein
MFTYYKSSVKMESAAFLGATEIKGEGEGFDEAEIDGW